MCQFLLLFILTLTSPSNQVSNSAQMVESIELQVNGSIDQVKDVLMDIAAYGDLHPLILSATEQDSGHFLIKERPYRFLPFTVKYKAYIERSSNDEVDYGFSKVTFIQPYFYYILVSNADNTTTLKLTIKLEDGPGIGRRILMKKMKKAQLQLWQAFEQSLNK